MSIVYVGLGSNLGDRRKNITNATILLGAIMGEIKNLSSIYETTPWGYKSDHLFMNAVAVVETKEEPTTCLKMAKAIEREMGRTYEQAGCYEDRIIDLDILMYDNLTVTDKNLTIPHPLIQDREFVLVPLCEVAPNLVHPVLKKTVCELLKEIKTATHKI